MRAGDELLARAALALDQHGHVAVGDLVEEEEELAHAPALPTIFVVRVLERRLLLVAQHVLLDLLQLGARPRDAIGQDAVQLLDLGLRRGELPRAGGRSPRAARRSAARWPPGPRTCWISGSWLVVEHAALEAVVQVDDAHGPWDPARARSGWIAAACPRCSPCPRRGRPRRRRTTTMGPPLSSVRRVDRPADLRQGVLARLRGRSCGRPRIWRLVERASRARMKKPRSAPVNSIRASTIAVEDRLRARAPRSSRRSRACRRARRLDLLALPRALPRRRRSRGRPRRSERAARRTPIAPKRRWTSRRRVRSPP